MPASADRPPRLRRLGDNIRRQRERLDWTQEELAHRADLERAYIAQLETGSRNPTLETLCQLAKALKIDVAELVTGLERLRGRPRKKSR